MSKIFVEATNKIIETKDYFRSRFLESEEEFKKTHSKESQKNLMCFRTVFKKLDELEDMLITENFKNDWGRTWFLCKLHHDK